MPLFRRIAKRGFSNKRFADVIVVVNVSALDRSFEDGETIDPAALREKGLAGGKFDGIKILGNGSLTKKLQVNAHRFSKSAEEKIVAAGGTIKKIN
jgi:large subunit ribosomal protein L15